MQITKKKKKKKKNYFCLSNKYSLFCVSCHCAYFSGIYHFHWRVVYCFSLGIQTHARDVVNILWLVA